MKIKILKANIIKDRLRGIAMVEALIAISILMVGIMAPLTLAIYSSKYSKLALNKITATYLGEEQIEILVNYKKSLDIYCFNNIDGCDNRNSFDDFFNSLNLGLLGCGSDTLPCFIDEDRIVYLGINKPLINPIIDINFCRQLYIRPGDIATCDGTVSLSEPTPFTRKLIIGYTDFLIDALTGESYPTAVKLTSVVCIGNPNCNANDNDSVTLTYHVYK